MKKSIAAALVALYFGAGAAAQVMVQPVDLRNAATVEMRDGQGQVVLKGDFTHVDEDADDTERKAALRSMVANAKASGNAEIEFENEQPKEQEVEFAGRDLTPGMTYTLAIDGHDVATATADKRGRVEIEVNVPLPGTSVR